MHEGGNDPLAGYNVEESERQHLQELFETAPPEELQAWEAQDDILAHWDKVLPFPRFEPVKEVIESVKVQLSEAAADAERGRKRKRATIMDDVDGDARALVHESGASGVSFKTLDRDEASRIEEGIRNEGERRRAKQERMKARKKMGREASRSQKEDSTVKPTVTDRLISREEKKQLKKAQRQAERGARALKQESRTAPQSPNSATQHRSSDEPPKKKRQRSKHPKASLEQTAGSNMRSNTFIELLPAQQISSGKPPENQIQLNHPQTATEQTFGLDTVTDVSIQPLPGLQIPPNQPEKKNRSKSGPTTSIYFARPSNPKKDDIVASEAITLTASSVTLPQIEEQNNKRKRMKKRNKNRLSVDYTIIANRTSNVKEAISSESEHTFLNSINSKHQEISTTINNSRLKEFVRESQDEVNHGEATPVVASRAPDLQLNRANIPSVPKRRDRGRRSKNKGSLGTENLQLLVKPLEDTNANSQILGGDERGRKRYRAEREESRQDLKDIDIPHFAQQLRSPLVENEDSASFDYSLDANNSDEKTINPSRSHTKTSNLESEEENLRSFVRSVSLDESIVEPLTTIETANSSICREDLSLIGHDQPLRLSGSEEAVFMASLSTLPPEELGSIILEDSNKSQDRIVVLSDLATRHSEPDVEVSLPFEPSSPSILRKASNSNAANQSMLSPTPKLKPKSKRRNKSSHQVRTPEPSSAPARRQSFPRAAKLIKPVPIKIPGLWKAQAKWEALQPKHRKSLLVSTNKTSAIRKEIGTENSTPSIESSAVMLVESVNESQSQASQLRPPPGKVSAVLYTSSQAYKTFEFRLPVYPIETPNCSFDNINGNSNIVIAPNPRNQDLEDDIYDFPLSPIAIREGLLNDESYTHVPTPPRKSKSRPRGTSVPAVKKRVSQDTRTRHASVPPQRRSRIRSPTESAVARPAPLRDSKGRFISKISSAQDLSYAVEAEVVDFGKGGLPAVVGLSSIEYLKASQSSKKAKRSAKSPYFTPPKSPPKPKSEAVNDSQISPSKTPKKRPVRGTVSCIPFPSLSAPHFGLIQEKLAYDPFRLLIAVTFLIRTHGKHAIPVFYQLMDKYPTPESLIAANKDDIVRIIRHLGLQNQRATTYQMYAQIWLDNPPIEGKRYPVRGYPTKESGRDAKIDEVLTDEDARNGWEIGHMTQGRYAVDSWRIFCRDILRELATGWNGEGSKEENFQPEWMRVLPEDKELRAYLRWMWLKEGFEWNPFTGEKEVASPELLKAAVDGMIAWDDAGGMRILDEPSGRDVPVDSMI
jgi:methyl-CpG-binding domain protein 4